MHHVTRLTLLFAISSALTGSVWAATAKPVEYKRADANLYWKGDVSKVEPDAVIVPAGKYTQTGDSYFITPGKKAPKVVYAQVINDWIEPITPPSMPASLGVAPDAMQIREPQGDVQVAFPSAPATFLPVTDGMTIPNGSVVKTGDKSTAAVLFGGVDSARLIPNTMAAVQQTVTPDTRTTEVDLRAGAVFSKVGLRPGEKEDYQVHTPFGVAAARGTDFVSVAMAARTDVWIAQGTVALSAPDGSAVGTVKSDGAGPLKIIRYPLMDDEHQSMMADSETMTAAMSVIPLVNVKTKALYDRVAQGGVLTDKEKIYLGKIKKIPCLIKLALVEAPVTVPPPAPAPLPTPPPAPVVVAVKPAPTPAASTGALEIRVRLDGKVRYQGAVITRDELKAKLEAVAKATPGQDVAIKSGKQESYDQVKGIADLCEASQLKIHFENLDGTSVPPPAPPAEAPAPTPNTVSTTPPSPAPAPVPAAKPSADAVEIRVRLDGKVRFQGAILTVSELKPKLDALAKSTPVVIKFGEKESYLQVKPVMDLCDSEQLKTSFEDLKGNSVPAPTPSSTGATAPAATPNANPLPPPPPIIPTSAPLPPGPIDSDSSKPPGSASTTATSTGKTASVKRKKHKPHAVASAAPAAPAIPASADNPSESTTASAPIAANATATVP